MHRRHRRSLCLGVCRTAREGAREPARPRALRRARRAGARRAGRRRAATGGGVVVMALYRMLDRAKERLRGRASGDARASYLHVASFAQRRSHRRDERRELTERAGGVPPTTRRRDGHARLRARHHPLIADGTHRLDRLELLCSCAKGVAQRGQQARNLCSHRARRRRIDRRAGAGVPPPTPPPTAPHCGGRAVAPPSGHVARRRGQNERTGGVVERRWCLTHQRAERGVQRRRVARQPPCMHLRQ